MAYSHYSCYIIYTNMAELNTNFGIAAGDLIFMLDRGYPKSPSIDLVGNRYGLDRTERMLLYRGVFDTKSSLSRREKLVEIDNISESCLLIDGFNVLITIDSYLQGLLVFAASDGYVRDVSEVYGNYRPDKSTVRALDLIAGFIGERKGSTTILLDKRADASSECASLIEKKAGRVPFPPEVLIVTALDHKLVERSCCAGGKPEAVVATSDTEVLDRIQKACDIPCWIIEKRFKKIVFDLGSLIKTPVR